MNAPALYVSANAPQRCDVRDISQEFSDEIRKMSGRCLDIGSGPGDSVVDIILPKLNPEASLICSDISEEMVSFGREKYADNKRLSFIKLDIESQELPNDLMEQFDHVTSSFCLHWCRDMRRVFKNIFDLLRPGGTVFTIFLAHFPSFDAYKCLAAMPRYQPYMKDYDHFLPVFQHSEQPSGTLKALMEDVGFGVHHCSVKGRSHTLKNLDVLHSLLAINPFLERIPADLIEEYKKDLGIEVAKKNRIIKKNNGENHEVEDHMVITYNLLVTYLQKPIAN